MGKENEIRGRIFDVKRFAVHDGPGIRTTVFLKGCSLQCAWCHNPEAMSPKPQISIYPQRCIDCGACIEACTYGAREENEAGERTYNRDLCEVCGECVEVCYAESIVMQGREVSVEEVMNDVRKDASFYEESGGGVTLSGGEPLLQGPFVTAVLRACKSEGFHTALDTCGMVRWEAFENALPFVDLLLFDIKHMDPELHQKHTGASNSQILENLRSLGKREAAIEIRMPIIPTVNDDRKTVEAAADMLSSIDSVTAVRLLPYHRLAGEKYISLGYENTMPKVDPPDEEKMAHIAGWVRSYGLNVITLE